MNLVLVYQRQTDGEILIKVFRTGASLRRFLFQTKMHPNDYCLIEGNVLKTFDNFNTKKGETLCHG